MFKQQLVKKLISYILCFLFIFSSFPMAFAEPAGNEEEPPVEIQKQATVRTVVPGNIYIPSKTRIDVELVSNISSKTHKKGELIDIRVSENLIINDVVVIPKGTLGKAIIQTSRRAGAFGRRGKLIITPQYVTATNNMKIPLIPEEYQSLGKGDGGAVAVAAAVSVIGGIFMKGTNPTFKAGTEFDVAVDGDIDLGCTPDTLDETMNINKIHGNEIIVSPKN